MILIYSSSNWKSNWQILSEELKSAEPSTPCPELEKYGVEKVERKITELTALLSKIDSKIKKLEESEIPSDPEEEEQAVKLEDKLKRRAVKIHKQLKKYHGENERLLRSKENSIKVEEGVLFRFWLLKTSFRWNSFLKICFASHEIVK